jgi:hypothetical protein
MRLRRRCIASYNHFLSAKHPRAAQMSTVPDFSNKVLFLMTTISPSTQVKAVNDQVSCDLAGEAAILDLRSGIYYGLDPVGAKVWELIQQPLEVSSIVSQILDEYDVDEERCRNDVLALLSQLLERDLIEVCS